MPTFKPYTEDAYTRIFSCAIPEESLIWHWDKEDREVTVVKGGGWKIQFDDSLPIALRDGDVLFIPKKVWHRVIKGSEDLIVQINEY